VVSVELNFERQASLVGDYIDGDTEEVIQKFQTCFLGLGVAVATLQLPAQTVDSSSLVPITPCRVADTRDQSFRGNGSPALRANTVRDFPILQSSCNIPNTALAYSLNVTIVPHQPFSYLTLWPTGQAQPLTSVLNAYSGAVAANSAIVPAGSNGEISAFATGETDLILDISGYFVAGTAAAINQLTSQMAGAQLALAQVQNTSTQSANQLASVQGQLNSVGLSTASMQTQINALANNTAVMDQTQVRAVLQAFGGDSTTRGIAIGTGNGVSGTDNTSIGFHALLLNTASSNTAVGSGALSANTAGDNNIAIGVNAGINLTAGEANDILLGSRGQVGDSGTIRIGDPNVHQQVYLAGVNGPDPDATSYVAVNPDNGRLSVYSSSRRYKEDIQDIQISTEEFMRLRPVQFRYKKPSESGGKPIQYGLVAEEAEEVLPQLVVHNKLGQPETIAYQFLPPILMRQVQEQQRQLEVQAAQIETLRAELRSIRESLLRPDRQ
jgi:hypothetical protein